MRSTKNSGQLLIVVILMAAVMAITLPLLFTIFGQVHRYYADSATNVKLDQTAKAAFAQISYTFASHPETWTRALANESLKDEGFDGERTFIGTHQIPYSVLCSREQTMLPNQLRVTVNLTNKGKAFQRHKIYQAIFSRKTMGVDLSNMRHAPAALYALGDLDLSRQGLLAPELDVQWGSIVCFGILTIDSEPNADTLGHHPRKFSRGDYQTPYSKNQSTDGREFWAQQSLGDPIAIDDDRYRAVAHDQTVGATQDSAGNKTLSGFISANDQVVVIRSLSSQIQENVIPVLYIDGSVRFESNGIDLGSGAMIVTSNAVFEDHKEGKELLLRVPSTAGREYPYLPEGARYPCQDAAGATCSSAEALGQDTKIDFRGFLYVKGDLYIRQDTTIAGVLRVDGRLRVQGGKRLTILFDDRVSRSIFTSDSEIQQEIVVEPTST